MRPLLVAVSVLGCASVFAQDDVAGGYLGVGLGELSFEEEVLPGVYTFDESASAWKLYGGYDFGERLGLELSWTQTSDLEDTVSLLDPDLGAVSTAVSVELTVLSLRALGYLPLSWGSPFAGIGYFDGDADSVLVVSADLLGSETVSASDSASGATAVLGVRWRLRDWNVRLEYEWWDADEADLAALGLAAAYRF